jgi:hypothetical protein
MVQQNEEGLSLRHSSVQEEQVVVDQQKIEEDESFDLMDIIFEVS